MNACIHLFADNESPEFIMATVDIGVSGGDQCITLAEFFAAHHTCAHTHTFEFLHVYVHASTHENIHTSRTAQIPRLQLQ